MLTAALKYAGHGWPVFAIDPTDKVPIVEHGVYSATTDERQIRSWWSWKPEANIAVRCSEFFVVDVDPLSGGDETLQRWIDLHGPMPRTWTARTGSGGVHYYFRHNVALEALPLGRLHKGAGIDIKGNGKHYVLVPPSQTKRGPYRWIISPREPLAAAPRWLIHLIVRCKTVKAPEPVRVSSWCSSDLKVRRAKGFAALQSPAISGSHGSTQTFKVCMNVARGFQLTEDEALEALADWNRRCEPPWSEDELRRKIQQALDHGQKVPMGAHLERRAS